MRRAGRALLLVACAQLCAAADYGTPLEIQLWDSGRTPLAHMVDVTNQFGLKVLAEHNFLNDNNIAFSPYGLIGVMVALLEGVDGESSFQITRAMQMPWNRNVMRVGFRDIHRTLKTYFVPEEGFLAGLALNNENVTFNESYKKILKFYGFDLDKEYLPTHPTQPVNDTTSTTVTSPTAALPPESLATTAPPPASRGEPVGSREETTQKPDTEDTSAATTTAATEMNSSTDAATQAITDAPTTETTPMNPAQITAEASTEAATTVAGEPTDDRNVEILTTSPSPSTEDTAVSDNQETNEGTTETLASEKMTETQADSAAPVATTTASPETNIEALQRRKRSILDFIFTNPPYADDYYTYRSYEIPQDLPSPSFDENEKMFLANGLTRVEVSYMQYDTFLPHAYLPHLEAAALRLPLDSERYYLLVVVPAAPGGRALARLVARMARESDLRDVHAALTRRWVRAIVPSFTVKGHITLTTDLQKLGVRDVFEPRQRDFTPMTAQPGVYVRSIEQAVSVAIRKYQPDEPKRNRYSAPQPAAHVAATHPFLYFVMDASVHVALMAGKMMDPLNTRIL